MDIKERNLVNDEQHKMNSNSMKADLFTKQEGKNRNDGNLGLKAPSSSQWMRTKDPRIVRVSRAFGGKDRHSKVCTIRGLRDRRVRLSVPTAIQLYDLQDRLGFNQPSKVVDWLLDAAKNEIEELPPLPVIPGHFSQNYQSMLSSHHAPASCSSHEGLMGKGGIDLEDSGGLLRSNFWSSNAFWDNKSKEVARETVNKEEKEEDKQEDNEGQNASSTYNFLTKTYHPSFQGVLNNSMPYGSYQNLMPPSNISLSHPGSYGFTSQADQDQLPNLNIVTMPSTLSLSTGSQVFVCPPGAAQSYLPSFLTSSMEIDPRQINHLQMLSSNSHTSLSNPFPPSLHSSNQNMRPLHFNLTPLHSQDSGGSQPTKDH